MLKIKRPKTKSIRTVIPPSLPTDVEKAVEAIVSSHNPSKSLGAIRPTKLYIKAKLNGSSNKEARSLAGIPPTRPPNAIFETPITKLILEEVLSSTKEFSDSGIVKRLKEMWDAKETVYIPVGEHVLKRKKKNWDVRKFAFTNVLELRGYKNRKEDGDKAPQATAIHFHVSEVPKQVAIETQAEVTDAE